jgi:hypothetical protein
MIDATLRYGLAPQLEKRRSLRRQPNDHNFGSLIMLAVTAGAFLLVAWLATKGLSFSCRSRQSVECVRHRTGRGESEADGTVDAHVLRLVAYEGGILSS